MRALRVTNQAASTRIDAETGLAPVGDRRRDTFCYQFAIAARDDRDRHGRYTRRLLLRRTTVRFRLSFAPPNKDVMVSYVIHLRGAVDSASHDICDLKT